MENYSSSNPQNQGKYVSAWNYDYYVDEFKRKTNKGCIIGEFQGKFSNSATTGSHLSAVITCERAKVNGTIFDGLGIALFEYGDFPVNNTSRKSRYYDIKALEENNNIITTVGEIEPKSKLITNIAPKNQNQIIEAIKNNNLLVFRINDRNWGNSYIFDVDCTGFKELFDSVNWNV